jgi:pyruvate dehydrogenase (quinone)
MGLTTADFLLQRLHENGVRRIYGYPGDGINERGRARPACRGHGSHVERTAEERPDPAALFRSLQLARS